MNENTRKKIRMMRDALDRGPIESALSDLESIRDEEREKFDNLSEGLQASERGQAIEASAESLESACDALQQILDSLDEVDGHLNDAMGEG